MYGPLMFKGIQYMNKSKKPNSGRPARAQRSKPKGRAPSKGAVGQLSRAGIATARSAPTSQPRISSTSKGSHVAHREFVGTVNGSVAFTANKFVCNPGMASTFPWLSVQAGQWEQYRFNRLRFKYLTRTATTTVGSVLMAPDYDPSDSAPASEAAVSTYQDCVEDAVWVESLVCELNVSSMFPNGQKKFVRSGAVGLEDLKLYDAANFFLCTLEETSAAAIGKLWVEYDVDFFTPQIAPSGDPLSSHTSQYEDNAAQALATTVAEPLLFPDLVTDPLGVGAAVVGVFTPPRGSYRVEATCSVIDTSAETLSVLLQLFKNGVAVDNTNGFVSHAVPASGAIQVCVSGIVNCDGSDTFQVQITATGAAGTLNVQASTSSLLVSPA